MFFEIEYDRIWDDGVSGWRWSYRRGTPNNPGKSICTSDDGFGSEKECRSAVASTKKSFAAARMAKVHTKE